MLFFFFIDGQAFLPQAPVCHPGWVHQCRERRCGGLHLQSLQKGAHFSILKRLSHHISVYLAEIFLHVWFILLVSQVGITLFTVSHRKSLWKHHEVRSALLSHLQFLPTLTVYLITKCPFFFPVLPPYGRQRKLWIQTHHLWNCRVRLLEEKQQHYTISGPSGGP